MRSHEYVLFNGGRGSGKTTAGAIQAILEAVEYQPGESGIVVAPTYKMLMRASMKEFFHWLPRQWIASWNKSDKFLTLRNGSEVLFASADNPDSLRGPNMAWAWLDEPRNLRSREAFDIVTGQIRRGQRKCWLTTTPSGIFHWIYDLFIGHPLEHSEVVRVKTNENPFNPDEYERSLRAQYTGAFAAQELDAEWVSFEGRILDNFDPMLNVSEAAEYNSDWDVQWGVDEGYTIGGGPGSSSYHPRVILLAQLTPQGGLCVFAEYYRVGELSEQSIATALSWPYKRPYAAHVDSSAGDFKLRLWDIGISTVSATHPVSEGIKNLRRLICDGNGVRLLKIHPRCANLIRELQLYRYDDRSTVAVVGEPKPLKVDDHGPDALRYLCWQLRYAK